jgi:hypothetical protein
VPRGWAPGRIVTAVLLPGFVGRNAPPADCRRVVDRASRAPTPPRAWSESPRALTARHVGVAPSIVNNNPETRERSRRSFSTTAGWCSRLNRLSSRPTLATARGEPRPITTGGDHGSPRSQRRPGATRPFVCSRNIPPGTSHFDLAAAGSAAAMNGHHRSLIARMSDKIFCRLSSGISLFGSANWSRPFSTFDQN